LPYDLDGLRSDLLLEGRPLVAVAASHRLARRGTVDCEELEDEPWIVGDASAGEPQFGAWPTLSGTPRDAYSIRDWPAWLGLVAAGLGLALISDMAAATVPPRVELVAVSEPDAVRRSALVVSQPERSPSADAMVEALREEGRRIRSATEEATGA